MFQALDTFNTAIVSPIYYVTFTTLTIAARVIMFKDWDDQNVGSIISGICGFIIVLSGTVLLHTSKEMERSSSFKGKYTPLSPTLSTRLCSTNRVVLKHEEEVEPCSEEVGARRLELHA
ncbi:probable magnesium transporter NIPA7 [Lycium ferocissimum]|uniref:probable magnesium transporter NIPA7 n=1 Tax=Lycium ferocissimum TaxID=112874 RepID=UPI00281671D7|nr:probable magnesium transporter NIPA7 [Lycium ferocissimum]